MDRDLPPAPLRPQRRSTPALDLPDPALPPAPIRAPRPVTASNADSTRPPILRIHVSSPDVGNPEYLATFSATTSPSSPSTPPPPATPPIVRAWEASSPSPPQAVVPTPRSPQHAHSRSWAPSSAAMHALRGTGGLTRPSALASEVASPNGGGSLPASRLHHISSPSGLDKTAQQQQPTSREPGPVPLVRRLFPDDPARPARRMWPVQWIVGAMSSVGNGSESLGGTAAASARAHARAGSHPADLERGSGARGSFSYGAATAAAARSGATDAADAAASSPASAANDSTTYMRHSRTTSGARPSPGTGHRRSPSTAAAAALTALRESLRAAGIVPGSIRRAKRDGIRSSFVAYKPPSLVNHPVAAWAMQLDALVRKAFQIAMHGTPLLLVLALIGPMLAVWGSAVMFQFLSATLAKAVFPSAVGLNASAPLTLVLPPCPASGFYCRVAVAFSPNDTYHSGIMSEMARLANLDPGKDVWGYSTTDDLLNDYYARNMALQRRPRHYLVQFNTFNGTTPANATAAAAATNGTWYTLAEGAGNAVGAYFDPQIPRDYGISKGTMLAVKQVLDTAIINVRSGIRHETKFTLGTFTQVPVPAGTRDWTDPGGPNSTVLNNGMAVDQDALLSDTAVEQSQINTSTQNAMAILSHYAANIVLVVLLAVGAFPSVLLIGNSLGQDKFGGMLGTLRQMNLFESAYWVAIALVAVIVNAVAAALALLPGTLANYPPVNLMGPGYLFLVLFLYGVSMTLVGALLSVATSSSPYTTSVVTVMILALAALLPFILSITDLNQLFIKATIVPWWDRIVANADSTGSLVAFYLLSLMPFFQLGRALGVALDYTWLGPATAANGTSTSVNSTSAMITASLTSLAHVPTTYNYSFPLDLAFQSPKTSVAASALTAMAGLILVSLMLSWYANQITGKSHHWCLPWYFMLLPSYWGISIGGTVPAGGSRDRVELVGIKQSFPSPNSWALDWLRCRKPARVKILTGVSLKLERGVCNGLLGHNGSGKSTLLDVLNGSAHASGGRGHVFGAPLGSRAARAMMGVCPQADVVIPALTARQHLSLWARFRGIPRRDMDAYLSTMLASVSLSQKADVQLGKYSGGMRRRLSILGACIGSPDLVVLDEVSNGLDPVQRRHVWEIVASLKSRGVAVLLTSHSAQEIQALSDEVVVLAAPGGRVVLHRNLMELRNEQAAVQILVTLPKAAQAQTHFPRALVQECKVISATTALISVSRPDFPHIARFLETPPVSDWELHTSLESYLPPQPGTMVHSFSTALLSEMHTDGAEEEMGRTLQLMPPLPRGPFAWAVILANQVLGMLRKNLRLQLRQVKHNVLFLVLFAAVMAGLSVLVSLDAKGVCSPAANATSGPPAPYSLKSFTTGQPTCDIAPYKAALRKRLAMCIPSASNLCSVPDYAPMKQTRYQSVQSAPPRIWARVPPTWQDGVMQQTTVELMGAGINISAMAQIIDYRGSIDRVPNIVLQRPRLVSFQETRLDDWVKFIAARQLNVSAATPRTFAEAKRIYPPSCLPLAMIAGPLPYMQDMNITELDFLLNYPDFALQVETSDDVIQLPSKNASTNSKRVQFDLRYWQTSPYPLVGSMFPVNTPTNFNTTTCRVFGVAPSGWAMGPAAPQLVSPSAPAIPGLPPLTEQDGWPMALIDSARYQNEGLWLLDGPVRHMISSAMTSLARSAIGPGAVIFSDFATVPDLQFSTRNEMLMNALVSVLLWLFFTMFILVPLAEHGQYLDFYRVNGLSLNAYWASHYLYCMIYAVPFLLVLGVTLGLLYPLISFSRLFVTLVLATHSIIGLSFLYAALAVPLFNGSRDMAQFLSYLVPLIVALPCVFCVYADVLSLPMTLTAGNLAFPGIAISFALRIVMQGFDLELLKPAFAWLAGIGCAAYVGAIVACWAQGVAWTRVVGAVWNIVTPCMPCRSRLALVGSQSAESLERTAPQHRHRLTSKSKGILAVTAATPLIIDASAPMSPSTPDGGFAVEMSPDAAAGPSTPVTEMDQLPITNDKQVRVFIEPPQQHPMSPRTNHSRQTSMVSLLSIDSQVYLEEERVQAAAAAAAASSGTTAMSMSPGSRNPLVIMLNKVTKRYRGVKRPVLDDISLGIDYGESFGLLGPSGCGKTNIVNLVTKQTRPTSGTIDAHGRLGLCPQDNVLLDDLSVLSNLQFYAQLSGYSPAVSSVVAMAAAKLVGLEPFMAQAAKTLSGGMKRRVSLAVALLGNPTTLIADEPTTALDVHHQRNLWQLLAKLRESGSLALLLVSHDMNEVQYLSRRIAIMAHGRIQCIGTAAELKRKYGDAWRLTLQCARLAASDVREWVASLPSVVYASYVHAAAVAARETSSSGGSSGTGEGGPTSALGSADTLVTSMVEAAKALSADMSAAAAASASGTNHPRRHRRNGFQIPQVVETTLTDVTAPFADKIKLEFCIPRVRLPDEQYHHHNGGPPSTGSTLGGNSIPQSPATANASSGAALAALVRAVAAEARGAGVSEWSVDTCSLEDVFLRVTLSGRE